MLANFRPEFDAAWMHEPWYTHIPIEPLDDDWARGLVGELLGNDPSLSAVSSLVVERTGGNPLFVEEMCRALVDDGTLVGAPRAYTCTRPVIDVRVPSTVHAVLASRIDRLPPEAKDLLQVAACIGRTFASHVLCAVAASSQEALAASLEVLCASELLQRHDDTYRFWHPLTQEVAYSTLLLERRTKIHAAVARTLEGHNDRATDEGAAVIADHWLRAGDKLACARWASRSAEWVVRNDMRRAVAEYRRVADLVSELHDEEADQLASLAAARLIRWGSRTALVTADERQELYVNGRQRAERSGGVSNLAHLTFSAGSAQLVAGDVAGARRLGREAADIAGGSPDPSLRSAMLVLAGYGAGWLGLFHECREATRLGLALISGDVDAGTDVLGFSAFAAHHVVAAQGHVLFEGPPAHARRAALVAAGVSETRSEKENAGWALSVLPLAAFVDGESDELESARHALDLAEEVSSAPSLALQGLGVSHLGAGRPGEAVRVLGQAAELYRDGRGLRQAEASTLAFFSLALTSCGRGQDAALTARTAIARARRRGQRHFEALGWMAFGAAVQSAAALDRAEGLLVATDSRAWQPLVHLERARLGIDVYGERQRAADLFEAVGATRRAASLRAGHARE